MGAALEATLLCLALWASILTTQCKMDSSTRLKMKKARILANNQTLQRFDKKDILTRSLYAGNPVLFYGKVANPELCPCVSAPLKNDDCVRGGCFTSYCAMHQF